ncbi:Copper resistance protein D [Brachymonas denitrificans DSM 15123]|uniref:Copper resistance protein D n=2 Tax=Brachymonas denitrificans TaxID=28220 RepID=A0A1H8HPD3_9BURK|nr:Copper resistance protein D [Brachymonas denitrificans DSM 15123]
MGGMYSYILLTHILAATIWTGGHLVLALTVLPRALKARDPRILLDFEAGYERVGMPALVIQIATGLWMATLLLPSHADWFSGDTLQSKLIMLKLALLAITAVTALDARLRIIPRLTAATLPAMARRVTLVTLVSVLFVIVGVAFRGGL